MDITERIAVAPLAVIPSRASQTVIDASPVALVAPVGLTNARTAPVDGAVPTESVAFKRTGATSWPRVADALEAWRKDIAASEPRCYTRRANEIVMTPAGTLVSKARAEVGHVGASVTIHALRQLLALRGIDFRALDLLKLRPAARAHAFNDLWERGDDRSLVMRLARARNGAPVVRAVVSELHSRERGDDSALVEVIQRELMAGAIPQDSRMRVIRQWDITTAEVIVPTAAAEVRRGDVVYARQTWVNSEVGARSFTTEGGTFRLVCLNGMTAADDSVDVRVRHVGDARRHFLTATRAAQAGIADHLMAFRRASGLALPDGLTRADVTSRFVTAFKLPERVGIAAQALWDADGDASAGNTLAGLANAFTRAAQAEDPSAALDIERAAGRVVSAGWARINA